MKTKLAPALRNSICFCLLTLVLSIPALAQDAVFTYQGRVMDNGTNFTGNGQFEFALVTTANINVQATATANLSGTFVTSYTVMNMGAGYTAVPAVTITGGGGSGATAHAVLNGSGQVTNVMADLAGSGYTSVPTVTIAPPPVDLAYTTFWSNDGTSENGSEPVTAVTVVVNGGLFTVILGNTNLPNMTAISAALFAQPNLQLRIWFNDGVNGFSVLNPLQPLTPAPYAISAGNLSGTLPAAQLTGTISSNQLSGAYPEAVTFNNAGSSFNGTFSGNGGSLNNLDSAALVLSSTNDSITAWGENEYGQTTVPAGLGSVTAVSVGYEHSLALLANGTVAGWGAGLSNNPSDGIDYGQSVAPPGLSGVTAIAAGYAYSVALENNGTVVAWGFDGYGETNVPAGLNNVQAISVGAFHAVALKTGGTVVVWGTNNYGQLNIPPGLNGVKMISAGFAHCLALESNGTVVAWGAGLTNNPSDGIDFGQSIVPAGLSNVVAVSAGGVHSLALKANGTVVAWGAGLTNNPGDGFDFGQSIVPPGLSNVVAVVAGLYHSLALEANGTVIARGDDQYGITNVSGVLNNVVTLAPGGIAQHALALRAQSDAPVAWLDSDNTFNGNIQVNGTLTTGGNIRLNGNTLWLLGNNDTQNGLSWFGAGNPFGTFAPDGPVLFGSAGGGLGTGGDGGMSVALAWNSSEQVGIGTINPGARLDLGSDAGDSKLLIGGGTGLGANANQLMFNLGGGGGQFSFMDSPGGTELVSIEDNGFGFANVGINTPSPTTSLDVHGSIALGTSGQFYAPGGYEDLAIVRGVVSSTGTILAGTGYTVTVGGGGFFTINFTTPFSAMPAVMVTAQSGTNRIATCTSVGTGSTGIWTRDTSGNGTANQFNFIAIGPK